MPPFDPQKHPVTQSLQWFVDKNLDSHRTMQPKSWPVSVVSVDPTSTIVEVKIELRASIKFPILKVPVAAPQYVRWPIQPGDKGVVFCAEYAIWGVSGLGNSGGTPDMTPQFNSTNGVFFPCGNARFSETDDPKKQVLYGPDGVIIRTAEGKKGKIDVNEKGVTIFMAGDETGSYLRMENDAFMFFVKGTLKFIIDAGGARYIGGPGAPGGGNFGINVTDTGTHIDNINFLPHVHRNVQSGPNDTGNVNTTTSPALASNENEP